MESVDIRKSLLQNVIPPSVIDGPIDATSKLVDTGNNVLDGIRNKLGNVGCGKINFSKFDKLRASVNGKIDKQLNKAIKISNRINDFTDVNTELRKILLPDPDEPVTTGPGESKNSITPLMNNIMNNVDREENISKVRFKLFLLKQLTGDSLLGTVRKIDLSNIHSVNDIQNVINSFDLPGLGLPKVDLNADADYLLGKYGEIQNTLKDITSDLDIISHNGIGGALTGLKADLDGINTTLEHLLPPELPVDFKMDSILNLVTTTFKREDVRDAIFGLNDDLVDSGGCVSKNMISTSVSNAKEVVYTTTLQKKKNKKKFFLEKIDSVLTDVTGKNLQGNLIDLPLNIKSPADLVSGRAIGVAKDIAKGLFKSNSLCEINDFLQKDSNGETASLIDDTEGEDILNNLPSCLNAKFTKNLMRKEKFNPFKELESAADTYKKEILGKLPSKKSLTDKLKAKKQALTLKKQQIKNLPKTLGLDKISENLSIHGNIHTNANTLLEQFDAALLDSDLLYNFNTLLINTLDNMSDALDEKIGANFNASGIITAHVKKLNNKYITL